MEIYKDTATLLMVIACAEPVGLPLKIVEAVGHVGEVEPGEHFNTCIAQLLELRLINVCNGIASLCRSVKIGGMS